MKTLWHVAVGTSLLGAGIILGFLLAKHWQLGAEFQDAMAVRTVISAQPGPTSLLAVLQVYERQVHRQDSWVAPPSINWKEELIEIQLRRYIAHVEAGQPDAAQEDLMRAAELRKRGARPHAEDVEFEKQLATRLFGATRGGP